MDTQSTVLVLLFQLELQRFALRVSVLQRVARAAALKPFPGESAFVPGVVTVRGRRLPVLSLRSYFGLPDRPLDPSQRFIFVHLDRHEAALLVDDIEDVTTLSQDAIAAAERPAAGLSHIDGIARLETGVLLIEDLAPILSVLDKHTVSAALTA